MRTSTKELSTYVTWYDFKMELQRRSGLIVLNRLWLRVKPRDPLPWYESHMKGSLCSLSGQIQRLMICPRCRGNLVLDRDIDGYYKRCIQCSFNVAFEVPALKPKRREVRVPAWRVTIKAGAPSPSLRHFSGN